MGHSAPATQVTREQLATLLWRYAESPVLLDYEGLTHFADAEHISRYAAQAITWAVAEGILTEKDSVTLDPTGTATVLNLSNLQGRAYTVLRRWPFTALPVSPTPAYGQALKCKF